MMSDKSDQRALAIESLQRRTERGLTELGQAIGGYRGVAEAMDAQLLRQDTRIEQLEAVNADLLAALREIAKGEGAFSLDPLTFANNTIENMKEIANTAIAKAEVT